MATRTMQRPKALPFTPDEAAQQLVASNSVAFVIGFILDQQIRIQHAFHSPLELQRRLGHLDPVKIAGMDTDALVEVFAQPPSLHRFPRNMAVRVQDCMRFLVDTYDGDPDRVWLEAASTADLRKRIAELPGFGEFKSKTVTGVLSRHFGLNFEGWEEGLPPYGALAYIDSLDELKAYQQRKTAFKKEMKAKAAASN